MLASLDAGVDSSVSQQTSDASASQGHQCRENMEPLKHKGEPWDIWFCRSSVDFSDVHMPRWLSKLLVPIATHLSGASFWKAAIDPDCVFLGCTAQFWSVASQWQWALCPIAPVTWLLPSHSVFSLQLGSYFENSAFRSSGIYYMIKLISGTSSLSINVMSTNFRDVIGNGVHFPTGEIPTRFYLHTQSSLRDF